MTRFCRCLLPMFLIMSAAGGCGDRVRSQVDAEAGGRVVESSEVADVEPGGVVRLVEHFRGRDADVDIARGGDGRARLTVGGVRTPVLCVPAPYSLKLKGRLPSDARLRVAFGLLPSSRGKAGRVRFSIRAATRAGTEELLSEELDQWRGPEAPNWAPVTLDVPGSSEEVVEIELATEPVGGPARRGSEGHSSAYAVWVNPMLLRPGERERPNIVVVVLDALRADHLGCYGYGRETSPFLDSLSRESALFEGANSQGSGTLHSVLSMLTSGYPLIRGSSVAASPEGSGGEEDLLLRPVSMPVSLQGQLQKSGYMTIASVGGGYLCPELGFDAGFDSFFFPGREPRLADQIAVLKRRLVVDGGMPFFLFFHTYEIHDYFRGRGDGLAQFDTGYQGPLRDPERLREAVFDNRSASRLTSAELQYLLDLYDGEILYADQCLADFLEWLLSSQAGEKTIVVITADHGEAFGERGRLLHGWAPYEEMVHVPLIIRVPDGRGSGRRISQPVGLVDLGPTLLEFADVEIPSRFVGRSLAPLVEGRADEQTRRLLSESPKFGLLAREGNWCYLVLREAGREELYDLESDPDQVNDLAGRRRGELRRMRQVLAELGMVAASVPRVVVAGERPEEMAVELECDGAFGYLDVPTLTDEVELERMEGGAAGGGPPASGRPGGWRAVVRIPAGDQPQVILVAPMDGEGTVWLRASIGGESVGRRRFHLGAAAACPDSLPVRIGPGDASVLLSERPPVPGEPESWGLWAWEPPAAAPGVAHVLTAGELHPAMLEDLRSLGYIR